MKLKSSVMPLRGVCHNILTRVMGKYLAVTGILIIMMSCGKDIDLFIPRTGPAETGDITRLMSKLRADIAGDVSKAISCPCYGDWAFEVGKDLVMVVPPDFADQVKYPCTNGYYEMDVTICDTKGEILIAGIPTVSEGRLLESRIEFNVDVHHGASPVKMAPGKKLRFMVNDPDPRDRMELFYGNSSHTGWIQADADDATWDNVFTNEWRIEQDSQEVISGFGYDCFSDSLGWINVDVFFEVPAGQRTNVCIGLPDEFTNTNTAVFMVFDHYKSLLALPGDPETKQFCEPYGATPTGFYVTFIVLAELGEGEYYFISKKTVITQNHTESFEPRKTPYAEIRNFISGL